MKKLRVIPVFDSDIHCCNYQLSDPPAEPIRILVITGGHDYQKEQFNQMLASLGENITYQIAEFPAAYDMFLPENRDKYDVLVFYHMWQNITDEQAKVFAECISRGNLWLLCIIVSVLLTTGRNTLI